MPRINLLPWREERREQREKQFKTATVGIVILAVLVTGYWYHMVDSDIAYQHRRNDYLKTEIKKVDKRLSAIKALKNKRKELRARMRIIEQLQQSRPQVVHLFDQLVRTLPDGVYLTSVKQKGSALHLDGIAQSSARISTYMRNISESHWLSDPDLSVIKARTKDDDHRKVFTLKAKIANPSKDKKP